MKKLLTILLVMAIAVVFVNDLGRWVQSSYTLNDHIREIADSAALAARDDPRQGWPTASKVAGTYNIQITAYSMMNTEVIVEARQPVPGTWVLARTIAYARRQPPATPFYVESRTTSYLH